MIDPLFEKIIKMETKELPDFLAKKINEFAFGKYEVIKDVKYTFFKLRGSCKNNVMLSSHIDTVHIDMPKEIIEEEFIDGIHISSPQGIGGDDRAGVYAVLKVIERLSKFEYLFPKYLLFTNFEEVGLFGSKKFVKDYKDKIDVKHIYEFDKNGSSVVFPKGMRNNQFKDYILKYFAYGGTGYPCDIDELMLGFNAAAVNIGVGYENWHKLYEHINIDTLNNQILRTTISLIKILKGKELN